MIMFALRETLTEYRVSTTYINKEQKKKKDKVRPIERSSSVYKSRCSGLDTFRVGRLT